MCQSVPGVKNHSVGMALDITKWVAQVLALPLLAGCLALALHVEQRFDELELGQQSRFTAEEGVKVYEHLTTLQEQLAVLQERLQTHLESTIPANELVKVVDYNNDQRELERRLTTLESRQ